MRILSIAVALFALAAFLVGLRTHDVGLFLYAAAALLCAGATYRSAHISNFLRVFEVVFAVETIVFGAAYLVDALGLWPQGLRRVRAAELAAADRRPVRSAGLRRLPHSGGADDDRHRRPLFLRAEPDDDAHLAGSPVRHGAEQAGDRRPGLPHHHQPVRSRAGGAAQLLQPRLLQRAAEQGRSGVLVPAPGDLPAVRHGLHRRAGHRVRRHLDFRLSLAAVALRLLHRPLARRRRPLPDGAGRHAGRQPRSAHLAKTSTASSTATAPAPASSAIRSRCCRR